MAADMTLDHLGAHRSTADHFARVLEARAWVTERLLGRDLDDNVVGTGVGLRQRPDRSGSDVVIRVFVRRKLPARALPPAAMVPSRIAGIGIDVEQVGRFRPDAENQPDTQPSIYRKTYRPVPAGVSIGSCLVDAVTSGPETGTVGCFLRDDQQRVHLLSNNHVLAHYNRTPIGTAVAQPGSIDGGSCPDHAVARLSGYWEVGFGKGGGDNQIDAAIAEMTGAYDPGILRDNGEPQRLGDGLATPQLELLVQKSGRTTGWTTGRVTEVGVTAAVGDRFGRGNVVCAAFRVKGDGKPFSGEGDSGSLVTTLDGNHPVGLLFSSDASDTKGTAASDIAYVLATLSKQLKLKLEIVR
jgi:hypothetical protein